MKRKDLNPLAEQLTRPDSFLLSLIGAEVLARRDEDGPLARPFRSQTASIKPQMQLEDRDSKRGQS